MNLLKVLCLAYGSWVEVTCHLEIRVFGGVPGVNGWDDQACQASD